MTVGHEHAKAQRAQLERQASQGKAKGRRRLLCSGCGRDRPSQTYLHHGHCRRIERAWPRATHGSVLTTPPVRPSARVVKWKQPFTRSTDHGHRCPTGPANTTCRDESPGNLPPRHQMRERGQLPPLLVPGRLEEATLPQPTSIFPGTRQPRGAVAVHPQPPQQPLVPSLPTES